MLWILYPFNRFATLRSDFDLAQHLSCSLKTVECGQIFLLACRQLRKKLSIILLDNLKIY